jgi:hypothetical protein
VSTISVGHAHGHNHDHEEPQVAARRELDVNTLTPGPGFGALARNALWFVGIVGIVVVIVGAFGGGSDEAKQHTAQQHALTSYHMGFLYALGLALGALGLQMIFQQFNAGWSAVVRRTAETFASLFWVVFILFLPIAIIELAGQRGLVFSWMDPANHNDQIYEEKAAWLNPMGWGVRAGVYFLIWGTLGGTLYRLSRKQDQTGDRWLTARARFISSFGLLAFALSTAFASFDWLMGMDYHWFSTMFGVYFFAGSTVSCLAITIIILTSLRISGRLGKTFTQEHQHDLGKLLFAFTVFWAYVTFAQYFLIWYSNVPEETAFYNLRNDGNYKLIFQMLCFGHFLLPFVVLLVRPIKRNPHTLRVVALWMVVMHAVDLVYIARPIVSKVTPGTEVWVDIAGIAGPVCLFLGFVVWKMGKAPLVPLKDPRLQEVLAHKNYV